MIRKSLWYVTSLLALTLLSATAAQAQPWTGAGPTAVIDEQSLGIYFANPQYIGFSPAAGTGDIIAYYNVTDTTASGNPPWNTLELGYFDNSANSQVTARLIQLNPCNGNLNVLCTVTSTDSGAISCSRCQFAAGSVNFNAGFTYYVSVTINRTSTAVAPKLFGVRVF